MNKVGSYLSGQLFDGGLRVAPENLTEEQVTTKFQQRKKLRKGLSRKGGRNKALLSLISTQGRILHVGCVDHPPLIPSKIANGEYLHKLLVNHAGETSVFGLDNNLQGLCVMRDMGFFNLYSNLEALKNHVFETVLIPDTIEHLQNPGQFLESISQLTFSKLIVSVPNAYSLENRLFLNREAINSDHRSLHSPYSLTKLLREAGFTVVSLTLADFWGPKRPFRSVIKFGFPLTREHLIVEAIKHEELKQ